MNKYAMTIISLGPPYPRNLIAQMEIYKILHENLDPEFKLTQLSIASGQTYQSCLNVVKQLRQRGIIDRDNKVLLTPFDYNTFPMPKSVMSPDKLPPGHLANMVKLCANQKMVDTLTVAEIHRLFREMMQSNPKITNKIIKNMWDSVMLFALFNGDLSYFKDLPLSQQLPVTTNTIKEQLKVVEDMGAF